MTLLTADSLRGQGNESIIHQGLVFISFFNFHIEINIYLCASVLSLGRDEMGTLVTCYVSQVSLPAFGLVSNFL